MQIYPTGHFTSQTVYQFCFKKARCLGCYIARGNNNYKNSFQKLPVNYKQLNSVS